MTVPDFTIQTTLNGRGAKKNAAKQVSHGENKAGERKEANRMAVFPYSRTKKSEGGKQRRG